MFLPLQQKGALAADIEPQSACHPHIAVAGMAVLSAMT
jgi:hypothetical protein